jgi:hypothetical protein
MGTAFYQVVTLSVDVLSYLFGQHAVVSGPHFVRDVTLIKKRRRTLPPLSASFADYLISLLRE